MARISLSIFLKKCKCGRYLVKDALGSSPYWTAPAPLMKMPDTSQMEEEACPDCGGDYSIPLGNFFHKKFCVAKEHNF